MKKHDLTTALIIFVMAFLATLANGGAVSKNLLMSAAVAGAGAVIHMFISKGESK